jgi:biopolymer transport protein ExbB/biopolymer transport protein TolQ
MQFSLAELWQQMGLLATGVIIMLAGMSLFSLAIAVEKWLAFQRATRESARFLQAWREALAKNGYAAAAAEAEKYPRSHVAHLVAAGTRVLLNTATTATRLEAYDRTIRRRVLTTGATVKQGLGLLATVGSTAPFVGLFGTVIGIVNAFQQMAISGQGGLGVVAAGIAEALVTTALGIGVALPAVWLFNYLTQRISNLLSEMECAAEELAVAALSHAHPTATQHQVSTERPEVYAGNAAWRE